MISYLNGVIVYSSVTSTDSGAWLTQQLAGARTSALWLCSLSWLAPFLFFQMKEAQPSGQKRSRCSPSVTGRYCTPSFIFHATLCFTAMAVILLTLPLAPVVLMET